MTLKFNLGLEWDIHTNKATFQFVPQSNETDKCELCIAIISTPLFQNPSIMNVDVWHVKFTSWIKSKSEF